MTLPCAVTLGRREDRSCKFRNWSTSNCGANSNSAVGECAEIMAFITPSRDAHGRAPRIAVLAAAGQLAETCACN